MTVRARHDALIRSLRRSGMTTVDQLATEVGASRRTVLRDLGALRDAGYVIHGEPGRGGGLRLDPGSVQATARLTVPEVFALLISVAAMRATRSLPFSGLADSGLARIEKSLPPDRLRDLRRLLDCLHVGPLSPQQDLSDMGPIDPALLPAFETAFLNRRLIRFRYRDLQGRQTAREVEPQALLILPPLWYLVAWDPARDDFRRFRMDRVGAPEAVDGTTFRPRHVPFERDVCPWRDLPR
jgi:predicted DNA-binding transcriptional regulator YafY